MHHRCVLELVGVLSFDGIEIPYPRYLDIKMYLCIIFEVK